LHPIFAAEIERTDLSHPPGPVLVEMIEAAMARYGVVVIHDADITDEQQKVFSRAFGPLELPSRVPSAKPIPQGSLRRDPDIFHAGNLDQDGNPLPPDSERLTLSKGAELFHTDSSFHAMPTKWSLLRGHEVPPPEFGGDTLFVDTRAAWDDLPAGRQEEVSDLIGIHDFWEGRRRAGLKGEITLQMRRMIPFPAVEHPLVRTMPNGRKALYVGGHCVGIKGIETAEAQALVAELYAHCTQDRYVYRHQWRPKDLVIWDNRCTMHAATPLHTDRHRRDMRRTTINESGPETSAYLWMGLDSELP
jgi:alpha-ketoglutarate-dependent 2,4-dichlorophenoxyacetate dioxygenase